MADLQNAGFTTPVTIERPRRFPGRAFFCEPRPTAEVARGGPNSLSLRLFSDGAPDHTPRLTPAHYLAEARRGARRRLPRVGRARSAAGFPVPVESAFLQQVAQMVASEVRLARGAR